MIGFITDLLKETMSNEDFRRVLYTTAHCQLVVMTLAPQEETGVEVHELDQFFYIESGEALAVLNGQESKVSGGSAIIVPEGTKHNIINRSRVHKLRLFTMYSPPEHPEGAAYRTKNQAQEAKKSANLKR